MTPEEDRIYQETIRYIESFLARPKMYVGESLWACYVQFTTLLSFLDMIANKNYSDKESLNKKQRSMMVKDHRPGALGWPDSMTFEQMMQHFQKFYDQEVKAHVSQPVEESR